MEGEEAQEGSISGGAPGSACSHGEVWNIYYLGLCLPWGAELCTATLVLG